MLVTPIATTLAPTKNHSNFIILLLCLTLSYLTLALILSPIASAGNNQPQKTSTVAKVFFSSGNMSAEPDIISLYSTLFEQTRKSLPEIQIAQKLKEQKSAETYTSWAKRLSPKVDFEIAQKHYLNKNISEDTSTEDAINPLLLKDSEYKDGRDVTDWNFDLDIPLYRRTLSVGIDISKLEYQLATNNLEIKTRELDTRLHELLSNYMVASYNLHNLKNSILISQEHVHNIQRGYDLRDQTKLALLRAQTNLTELEARKDLNEQERDTAFRDLLDFTAIPENNPTWSWLKELLKSEKQTAGCINSFSALTTSYEKLQNFLRKSTTNATLRDFFLRNSLLYKKILLERKLAKSTADQYTQSEWPELFVRGEFDKKEDTRLEDYSGKGSISLVLSVPLFSGGTLVSNTKTKDMASKISSIQEFSDVLRTVNSIANKKKTIASLQEVFTKQLIHLQQQQEIVRLSFKSYQLKQTSMQDLLTSKNKLIDAKNFLMRTTADLGILLRQFAWELGTPLPAPSLPLGPVETK
jgi:outer membrane protein TolC